MSFFKVVENLSKREDGSAVKVMIHSLSVSDQPLSPIQVVKMTEALKSYKIEKFIDL